MQQPQSRVRTLFTDLNGGGSAELSALAAFEVPPWAVVVAPAVPLLALLVGLLIAWLRHRGR